MLRRWSVYSLILFLGACAEEPAPDIAFGTIAGEVSEAKPFAKRDCRENCETNRALTCDPLDPYGCDLGDGCYANSAGTFCADVYAPGQPGDPCSFLNECAAGSQCIAGNAVPGCTTAGCCATFCDKDADCGPGTQCEPILDNPPDACWERVGVCADP